MSDDTQFQLRVVSRYQYSASPPEINDTISDNEKGEKAIPRPEILGCPKFYVKNAKFETKISHFGEIQGKNWNSEQWALSLILCQKFIEKFCDLPIFLTNGTAGRWTQCNLCCWTLEIAINCAQLLYN